MFPFIAVNNAIDEYKNSSCLITNSVLLFSSIVWKKIPWFYLLFHESKNGSYIIKAMNTRMKQIGNLNNHPQSIQTTNEK